MRPAADIFGPGAKGQTLPLTAFEEMFFWGDCPALPCLCYSRMRWSGVLDRRALESAAQIALERHPLLRSHVELVDGETPRWIISSETACAIDWQTDPLRQEFAPEPRLDLTCEHGLRLHVRVDGQRTELLVVVHHACVDGAGAFQFIEDLMIAYAIVTGEGGPRVRLSPLDPELLATRGRFDLTLGKFVKAVPELAVGLLGVRQYLMRTPAPLTLPTEGQRNYLAPAVEYPAVIGADLDLEETGLLRHAARRCGAGITVNDILTRELFMAIAAWRRREKFEHENDWLRLMIPTDLRTKAARELPAANMIGAVFLDRQGLQLSASSALLQGIHEELDLIKKRRLGLIFVGSVLSGRFLPGGLRRHVPQHRRLGTAAFSNLGRLYMRTPLPRSDHRLMLGSAVLEKVENLIPFTAGMAASFCATGYAQRMNLTLHYDSRVLSAAQAKDLMTEWATRLRETGRRS